MRLLLLKVYYMHHNNQTKSYTCICQHHLTLYIEFLCYLDDMNDQFYCIIAMSFRIEHIELFEKSSFHIQLLFYNSRFLFHNFVFFFFNTQLIEQKSFISNNFNINIKIYNIITFYVIINIFEINMDDYKRKNVQLFKDNKIFWRESPPGPEQIELEKLFQSGLITDIDTPKSIRDLYSIFQKYSLRVFGTHFRKTKAKLGLIRKYNFNILKINFIMFYVYI